MPDSDNTPIGNGKSDGTAAGRAGPWVEWAGGECPVPADTIVDVRHADGTVTEAFFAGDAIDDDPRYGFDWWKHVESNSRETHGFIVADRVLSA